MLPLHVTQILSDDYSKAAFLCEDRSIHFHAKYGQHYSTRVPSFGRDLAYAPFSADLLVVGSAPEVYRCAPVYHFEHCNGTLSTRLIWILVRPVTGLS